MTELIPLVVGTGSEEPEDEEVFDFSSPEDVLIEIIEAELGGYSFGGWKGWSIESETIINEANPEVTGAASYEMSYGGFLDQTIMNMTDCPKRAGWFVVTGITAVYSRGDGWETDDDMDFDCTGIRPATAEEVLLA